MKKSVWYVFTVAIMLFGCSPKFQEFNDSGFGGGGFTVKIPKNNLCKSSKKLDNQSYALIEDSINSSETILKNEFSLFITATSNNSFSKNNSKYKPVSSKKENRLFSFETKQQKTLIQKKIIPNKSSSFYRWYFFILAIAAFLGTLFFIIDSTGPGAGSLEAILSVLMGIVGVICTIGFINYSLKVDKYIRNRCLCTKIGIIFWFALPISIPLFLIGILYDYFKKGIKPN